MSNSSGYGDWVTIDIDAPEQMHSRGHGQSLPGSAAGEATPQGFDVVELEFTGTRAQAVENGRNRMAMMAACFLAAFCILGFRVLELTLADDLQMQAGAEPVAAADGELVHAGPVHRVMITDRNGEVLATDVSVPSLYVDARKVIEPNATADALLSVLPDLDRDRLIARLTSDRAFQWISRKLGPRQQALVHALGLPGIGFKHEPQRVYPKGHSAAHVLGYVDTDNRGIAGIERGLDTLLAGDGSSPGSGRPVQLALDMRVQHAVEEELAKAMATFSARSAAGVVLDVHTGEVRALVSLPDYDPNAPMDADDDARFNRATRAIYEMGSTFKVFTAAIAMDAGVASMASRYDARKPLKVGGHTIHDFHAEDRILTMAEVVMHSSNIGSASMALDIGVERHRSYLDRLGLLTRPELELPEVAQPLLPPRWKEIETMTISFGHGLAVSPLQLAAAGAALGNGGYRVSPTLLALRDREPERTQVLSGQTASDVLGLMRRVVGEGTGGQADVPGYDVAGKTGTAEKPGRGGYKKNKLITSFLGLFPARAPQYLVLVLLDEPNATKQTYGYATAGWNAAPTAGQVIRRVAPILGVRPVPSQLPGPAIVEAGLVR
ncbi:penicillin-binding protein 2 [Pyruvatibacter sp.]|uniref:peptidoglycan D,D-transpeptidase FtsI family protein n=1 Tax=Pyruvatibacter sp. TaxID=1981328 RepID=UPI0032EF34B2